jgi:hypothetical protein
MSNYLIILKDEDYMIWPILTYIVKLFMNIYYLLYVIPLLYNIIPISIIIIYDIIQIFISITYNLKKRVPFYDTIDYVSINTKILINSFMYYIAYISKLDNITWHIIQDMNIIYTVYMMYISLCIRNNDKYYICRKEKYTNIIIIFLLGVIPMLLDNSLYRNNIYINYCILSYIIGGIIWVMEIPERYMKIRYFDSVGWMHVCIIIGDLYLINSLGYIR